MDKRYRYIADVLIVGMERASFQEYRNLLTVEMRTRHAAWYVRAELHKSLYDAATRAARWAGLDIVYIRNDVAANIAMLTRNAPQLCRAIYRHPDRPCVLLHDGLQFLKPIFDARGIQTRCKEEIATIIDERHKALVA